MHLYAQSSVRAHTELAWLLACRTPLGHLHRMAQFKAKGGGGGGGASLGLLSYPVLQAADILLYRATHVPVGEDQEQHLELAREVAAMANAAWAAPGAPPLFPRPVSLRLGAGGAGRVMSLRDGRVKMSKSDPVEGSRINMDDEDDVIVAKVRAAKTDSELGFSGTAGVGGEGRPEKANLVRVLAALRGVEPGSVEAEYIDATSTVFKAALTEAIVGTVAPVRERMKRLLGPEKGEVEAALKEGADAAQDIAEETMAEVRRRVGYA